MLTFTEDQPDMHLLMVTDDEEEEDEHVSSTYEENTIYTQKFDVCQGYKHVSSSGKSTFCKTLF